MLCSICHRPLKDSLYSVLIWIHSRFSALPFFQALPFSHRVSLREPPLGISFDISIHGIDLNKSLPHLDFGKGFYTTDDKKKAIDRALKKTSDYNRRNHCSEDAYLVDLLIDESMFPTFNTKEIPR